MRGNERRRGSTRSEQAQLALDAREIRHRAGGVADFVEQPQPVLAQLGLVGALRDVDRHLVEERIHLRAQLRHRAHGGGEVLARDGGGGLLLGGVDGLGERPFLVLAIERRIGPPDIVARVLLLLDADDVGGALVAGEQVLAVLGVEEFSQRLDAADDQQEVILAFERENGINKIVPSALFAELAFETVGEEG